MTVRLASFSPASPARTGDDCSSAGDDIYILADLRTQDTATTWREEAHWSSFRDAVLRLQNEVRDRQSLAKRQRQAQAQAQVKGWRQAPQRLAGSVSHRRIRTDGSLRSPTPIEIEHDLQVYRRQTEEEEVYVLMGRIEEERRDDDGRDWTGGSGDSLDELARDIIPGPSYGLGRADPPSMLSPPPQPLPMQRQNSQKERRQEEAPQAPTLTFPEGTEEEDGDGDGENDEDDDQTSSRSIPKSVHTAPYLSGRSAEPSPLRPHDLATIVAEAEQAISALNVSEQQQGSGGVGGSGLGMTWTDVPTTGRSQDNGGGAPSAAASAAGGLTILGSATLDTAGTMDTATDLTLAHRRPSSAASHHRSESQASNADAGHSLYGSSFDPADLDSEMRSRGLEADLAEAQLRLALVEAERDEMEFELIRQKRKSGRGQTAREWVEGY